MDDLEERFLNRADLARLSEMSEYNAQEVGRVNRIVYLKKRLSLEVELLRQHLPLFAASCVVLFYGAMMVFRNLAFYRFEGGGKRLQDIGFELLPDWEFTSVGWIMDLPMYLVSLGLIIVCGFTLNAPRYIPGEMRPLYEILRQKPFIINILLRYVLMLCIGHILRFLTYIGTTFPGSSAECLGDVSHSQPKTLVEVFFTRFALKPGENCGDLLFSGHMMQMITPVLCFQRYGIAVFEYSSKTHRIVVSMLWVCIILLGCSIIVRRHHYTQDVVAGAYITPLLWHFLTNAVIPIDPEPKSLKVLSNTSHAVTQ